MRYWEDPFVAPVPGCFTSPFGVKRVRNGKPTGDYHRGVDQRSPTGYPVRAVAAGHQDRPAVHRTGRHRGSRSRPGVRNDVSAHVKLARAAECSREPRRCDRVRGLHRSLQRSSSPLGHLCEWCPGQSIAMGNAAAVQRLSQPRSQAITKRFPFERNLPPSYRLSSSSNLVCAVKVSNRIYTLTRTDEEKSTGGVNP